MPGRHPLRIREAVNLPIRASFAKLRHETRQYKEIYQSPYATDEERKMLGKDLYYFGVVPREFHQTPTLTKAKIKRNKQILRQRKAEKAKTGKFSTKVALER